MSSFTPTPGTPQSPNEYVALSPDGKHVKITRELFEALMMMGERTAGSFTVHFKNRGICEVEVAYKLKPSRQQ